MTLDIANDIIVLPNFKPGVGCFSNEFICGNVYLLFGGYLNTHYVLPITSYLVMVVIHF